MLQYNQITQLISELLYKHDCVIVPNFGGFVARQHSAHFSKGNSVLHPPTKQLLFNKNLVHQDGLLVSALMEKSAITFNDAVNELNDYKDYIQSLLVAKKRFELQNIGLLYIDTENSLRFEPKADVNFLLEAFGFEPVVSNELVIEVEKPVVSKQFEDRKAIVVMPEKQKRSYAKIATLAIGLPATLAFLLFAAYSKPMKPLLQSSLNPFYTPEKTYTPNKENHRKAFVINTIEKQSIIEDDNGYGTFKLSETGNVLVSSSNESDMKVDKTSVSKYVSTTKLTKHFDGNYQVVVGCFGVVENANKLISELQKSNMDAGISGTNAKGLHVVSCGGFNSKEEATQLLVSIKASYPNAWVMSK
jgi:nucleoid DNA-binding protein